MVDKRCFSVVVWGFFLLVCNITPISASERIDQMNFPVLRLEEPAMKGEAVWWVQARLNDLGYTIKPTGVFDRETADMVEMFQASRMLAPMDGMVTQEVWKALEADDIFAAGGDLKPGNLWIEIDLATCELKLMEKGELVRIFTVAIGKKSTPSPIGEWKVISKGTHWGNGFGTRWIGLNVPWGIYGIHGTNKPYTIGDAASHGCIRLNNHNVEELYPLVPWGTTVRIVSNGQMVPSESFRMPVLQKGQSGQSVVYLQSRIQNMGYPFIIADGRFGNQTEQAIWYLQAMMGLEPDGIAQGEFYQRIGF